MRTILTSLHSKFIHNSLALPCLAAYCGNECGELLIREFTVHEPRETVLGMLLAENPDVVAFSVYIWNRQATLELVDALAVARPEVRIVLGGPEVSFDGAQLFEMHQGVSALVHGEGELPLKALLSAWQHGESPSQIPRLTWRSSDQLTSGGDSPPLANLDDIPSPFQAGLVDLDRGFVYLETSRGCPYRCSFCMSALDDRVRSFSMPRIQSDLLLLMEHRVAKIKLVDRTFNYNPKRAREIFQFILENNRNSHFHFEIGAHLLDAATLELLRTVPPDMFQFEIGVQSTLERTLASVNRQVPLERLEENIRQLQADGCIHLHLDLVAGLPGESYSDFLASINRVAALQPDHLQIEPVKVLPGSPLRLEADQLGLHYDPNPPYTVLGTPDLSFEDLEQLRGMSRLMDLTWNSGHFGTFVEQLSQLSGSPADGLEQMTCYWREKGLFRFPMSRHDLFLRCKDFIHENRTADEQLILKDALAYDYALCERVNPKRVPDFFNFDLSEAEQLWVEEQMNQKMAAVKGKGIKLQYFAAAFTHLPQTDGRTVLLFLYRTKTGEGRSTEVLRKNPGRGTRDEERENLRGSPG
jgi:anaerobic magnesium-protoporphyrin IX monomethyl ester cyclase